MKTGAELIADERARQTEVEGWTPDHDDLHVDQSMALAAALYASPGALFEKATNWDGKVIYVDPWPWKVTVDDVMPVKLNAWDKRKKHSRKRQLIIAGALIAAEIDRLNRA